MSETFLLTVLLLFLLNGGIKDCRASGPVSPIVWTASSATRIFQNAASGSSTSIQLYAAKNETTSFQIGIQAPATGLTNVSVSCSGLSGANGDIIRGSNVMLFRESYISVPVSPPYYWTGTPDGTNPPGPAGLYPDGLIPFVDPETGRPTGSGTIHAVPFSVSPTTNQPIWVDLHVPAEYPSGDYSGSITVTSGQGSASINLKLHVWGFVLPQVPSLKTAFQAVHRDPYMSHELLRNRVSPEWEDPNSEQTLVDSWGLTATNLWFSSGVDVANCSTTSMPPAPSVAQFLAAASQHGTNLLLYNFSADEISHCPQLFPTLKQWAANMHAAGIKNLVTVPPVSALEDDGTGTGHSAVDIWTVLPLQYDAAQSQNDGITEVLAKGDAVWCYNVLVQDGYSPKMEINFTPLDYRLTVGFLSESLGISGFQQWSVDQWTANPWNDMVISPGGIPSDGFLVYPGAPVGIVGYAPSMRLKWLRDGVNDFEYVEILKRLGQGSWALQQASLAGRSWRTWTRDFSQVEAIRLALGTRIDAITNPIQPPAGLTAVAR